MLRTPHYERAGSAQFGVEEEMHLKSQCIWAYRVSTQSSRDIDLAFPGDSGSLWLGLLWSLPMLAPLASQRFCEFLTDSLTGITKLLWIPGSHTVE